MDSLNTNTLIYADHHPVHMRSMGLHHITVTLIEDRLYTSPLVQCSFDSSKRTQSYLWGFKKERKKVQHTRKEI